MDRLSEKRYRLCAAVSALVICLFPLSGAEAGERDFARIDAHAVAVNVPADVDVPGLARILTRPAKNDSERIRAISWWMANNIRYDHETHRVGVAQLRAGTPPMWVLPANEPAAVLRNRKAICSGYAKLCVALCKSIDVDAVEVGGATRYAAERHSWNAVRIGGAWRLVDVSSMASGAGNNGDAPGRPIEFYFLTPPDQLIFSHFPDDPRWQLLPRPVSKREFDAVPVVLPPLFVLGVTPRQLRTAASKGVGEFVTAALVAERSITLVDVPLARRLRGGVSHRFCIRAADHAAMHINDGGTRREIEKRNGLFEATVTPQGPFLHVGMQKQGKAIEGILQYDVGDARVEPADRLGPHVTALINAARRHKGAGDLVHDMSLDETARGHAEVMARARSTPGRERCLVAAADNPDAKPAAELAEPLVGSMLQQEKLRDWALAPQHTGIGAAAVTADGKTYFCIEFR